MIDWAAAYVDTLETRPVMAQVKPGYLRELLPDTAPEKPESFQQILDDMEKSIMPGVFFFLILKSRYFLLEISVLL